MSLLHSVRAWQPRRLRILFQALALATFCGALSSGQALAEEFEQHHAHEHGKITLNMALEGQAFVIELDAPAANVVGFEHAPRTPAEHDTVASAAAWIRAGKGLFEFPAEANCRFSMTEFADPQWEPGDHDEPHGASHSGEIHEHHADYEARFTYLCANPAKLTWLAPQILSRLLNVTEARVNLVTARGQRSETVTSAQTRIRLG